MCLADETLTLAGRAGIACRDALPQAKPTDTGPPLIPVLELIDSGSWCMSTTPQHGADPAGREVLI